LHSRTYYASMSYKSLLFCPDEKTAGILTQILTELEFAVESANEPFGAVKKLNEERFDALVVDCQNEQDAALLFKTARDSAQNHSSLSVAVVEGQMGVAKAFRIGANLVLTKPINVEQSKGTLRVARGLLRKNNEVKPAPASPKPAAPPAVSATAVQSPATPVLSPPARVSAPSPQPEAPFSAFQVEADPTPAPEAAEVALLESLPDVAGKLAPSSMPTASNIEAVPVAASTSSQAAAAVAPALEKAPLLGSTSASAAPMVTNEPIVPEQHYDDPLPPPAIEVPGFSSLESASTHSGGAVRFFKFAAILAVVFVAGYFGWQKIQPLRYLQNFRAAHTTDTSETPQPVTSPQEAIAPPPSSATASPTSSSQPLSSMPADSSTPQPAVVLEPSATPAPENDTPEATDAAPKDVAPKSAKIETIEVQEMHMPGDPKPTAPKPQVLKVKPDVAGKHPGRTAIAAPPQVQVSSLSPSAPALPNLTSVDATLPKLATGAVKVSQGVSQGLVIKKVPPAYPPMALQMHREGSVELLATISKRGSINDVKVLSGDTMLAKAATDAVRQWKYRPYLLNGEPVDIQTQITIVFKAPH
jgi:periplasmic protein TonB